MKKALVYTVAAVGLFVPILAFAQSSTTGLLNVYVQVINQTNSSYGPGNFTVSVSGQNPTPTNFQGSIQGTLVTINPGAYSVALINNFGFNTSYSVGCDNTMLAGGTQTCVITVNAGSYNYFPYVYPYTYQVPPLTCRTDTATVGVGQPARFTAVGGVGGTYNWRTPYQNFPNSGPVLTAILEGSGVQSVTVTNAAQTATCTVTVSSNYYYPQPASTVYPTYNTYPVYTAQPSYAAYTYPRFPNTGLEPVASAQIAFALVLLLGAAIAAYPYARKAFTLAVR